MAQKDRRKIDTGGGGELGQDLNFGGLDAGSLPSNPQAAHQPETPPEKPKKKRKRPLRVRREKSGRGGKTVMVIYETRLGALELQELAKLLRKRLGVGGTVKDGAIEVQTGEYEKLAGVLEEQGFLPKRSGG